LVELYINLVQIEDYNEQTNLGGVLEIIS